MSTNLTNYFGQNGFDATSVDLPTGGGSFTVGKHKVVIVESEITATSDGTGGMLVFTLQACDQSDPDNGKTMKYRLNLFNANEKAAKIAASQLAAVCHVTGQMRIVDAQQLHNIPFVVEVGNQKLTPEQTAKQAAGETVEPYREIKSVFDVNGNKPGQQNAQPAQTAQNQAQAQQGAAWGNNAQQAQQQQQQPQQNQQPAWGNQQQQAQQQPAQNNAPAWGQNQQAQQQQPAWGNQGGNQQQQQPAWGAKS